MLYGPYPLSSYEFMEWIYVYDMEAKEQKRASDAMRNQRG